MIRIYANADGDALAMTPPGPLAPARPSNSLRYYRDLILVLVGKEFKVRYKSTFLGYAWSVLHPLAFALVFFGLFRSVMRIEMRAYPLFLIAGLFPWQWTSNTVISSNAQIAGTGPNGAYLRLLLEDFSRPAARRSGDRLEQILLAERTHFVDEGFQAAVVCNRCCERFGLRL